MYAIVEIAGQQIKVEKDQRYFVNRLKGKEGEKVVFDNVLLLEDKGKISVGAPAVKGAHVTAKIEHHLKDDKVIVFKKKRRKGYQVKNGHRQHLSEISIQGISTKAPAKKAEPKSADEKPKASTKAASPKKATAKKETTKKVVAKKTEKKVEKAPAKKAPAKKAAPKKDK
jgi:large subunit ribosomal protein L21|tara:strand:+ start:424 stop:933 length:510 start_codon:yes stop_codon:yes gene_type:complete